MKKLIYDYKKFKLEILIPKQIENFMRAAEIDKKEVLNKSFWKMEVEDSIFFSHEKHPTEKGYVSDFQEPLSKSNKITCLIYGFYLTSKKIFELNFKEFIKKESLVQSSANIKGGWRIYFSFYD